MDLTPFHGPPAAAPQVPGFAAQTLLGFGAHGEVWRAQNLLTGSLVALKVGRRAAGENLVQTGVPPDPGDQRPGSVPPDHADHAAAMAIDQAAVAAIEQAAAAAVDRETALLCRIDHPHIVRLQQVVPLDGGGLALVLDLAAGGSLASLVAARGRFRPGEVSTLLIPLAGALSHLHQRGVSHGDIAPGNVLFAGDGRPLLGDLGVARVLGTRLDGTAVGWATPGFTDPALATAGRRIDSRAADLWGLAAVGWFALTGHPPQPYGVATSPDDSQAPALTELLAQCLVADPAARPGLDELADRAWQAARPIPVRLVTARDPISAEIGLPPLSDRVTRPVPLVGASGTAAGGAGGTAGDGLGGTASGGAGGTAGGGLGGMISAGAGSGSAGSGRSSQFSIRSTSLGDPVDAAERGAHDGRTRLRRRAQRFGVAVRRYRVVAAGALAVVVLTGLAVEVGAGLGTSPSSREGEGAARAAASSAGVGAPTSAGLDTELGQALARIGQSRAAAFAVASAGALATADQRGSPAYREDLALVQRLRARGYRLQGVGFRVTGVHVLRNLGETVDVAAVVTTSAHHRVTTTASANSTSLAVPPDGPRSLVFTLVALDQQGTGANRWRVRTVRAGS